MKIFLVTRVSGTRVIFFCLTALGSFILALKEEGSDENYDSNIEILLNYELPIVADITLLRQNEIFKLKIPLTSI